jgi:hypothetical protein
MRMMDSERRRAILGFVCMLEAMLLRELRVLRCLINDIVDDNVQSWLTHGEGSEKILRVRRTKKEGTT